MMNSTKITKMTSLLLVSTFSVSCASNLISQSPLDFATSAERLYDPISGVQEVRSVPVPAFTSKKRQLSGTATLRSASELADQGGKETKDGAILEINMTYSVGTPYSEDARLYNAAFFPSGSEALAINFSGSVVNCSEAVEEVYQRPIYSLYGANSHYGYGRNGLNRRSDHYRYGRYGRADRQFPGLYHYLERQRELDRRAGGGYGYGFLGPRHPGRGQPASGTVPSTNTGSDTGAPVTPNPDQPTTDEQQRAEIAALRARPPGARHRLVNPEDGRRYNRSRETRHQPKAQPQAVGRPPSQRPAPVASSPRPQQNNQPTQRPQRSAPTRPSRERPKSQPNRAVDRSFKKTRSPRTNNRSNRNERPYYPGGGYYADVNGSKDYKVSYRCERNETLRLFVDRKTLDAVQEKGLTLIIRPEAGNEEVLTLTPAYVQGYLIAAPAK